MSVFALRTTLVPPYCPVTIGSRRYPGFTNPFSTCHLAWSQQLGVHCYQTSNIFIWQVVLTATMSGFTEELRSDITQYTAEKDCEVYLQQGSANDKSRYLESDK